MVTPSIRLHPPRHKSPAAQGVVDQIVRCGAETMHGPGHEGGFLIGEVEDPKGIGGVGLDRHG